MRRNSFVIVNFKKNMFMRNNSFFDKIWEEKYATNLERNFVEIIIYDYLT